MLLRCETLSLNCKIKVNARATRPTIITTVTSRTSRFVLFVSIWMNICTRSALSVTARFEQNVHVAWHCDCLSKKKQARTKEKWSKLLSLRRKTKAEPNCSWIVLFSTHGEKVTHIHWSHFHKPSHFHPEQTPTLLKWPHHLVTCGLRWWSVVRAERRLHTKPLSHARPTNMKGAIMAALVYVVFRAVVSLCKNVWLNRSLLHKKWHMVTGQCRTAVVVCDRLRERPLADKKIVVFWGPHLRGSMPKESLLHSQL